MQYFLTLALTCLVFGTSLAQKKVNTFQVVDSATLKPVAAVSIAIVRAKLAISTERDGIFNIPGDLTKMRDTVIISAQGYNPYKILLQKMHGMDSLKLIKYRRPKTPVVFKDGKELELNKFKKSEVVNYAGIHTETAMFDYLQLAQQFYLPKSRALLKRVNLSRLAFNLSYEAQDDAVEMERITFRIRVYEADTIKGGPGNELSDEVIEVKNKESQSIGIDLSDYQILIPGKSFFIAIEWMRDFYNQGWTMVPQERAASKQLVNFRPAIGISPVKGTKLNMWALTIKRQWKPYTYFSPDYTDLAMTAILLQ
ncbi:MAG: hypothetical protein V4687_16980 [Bacteroidota bacterium]